MKIFEVYFLNFVAHRMCIQRFQIILDDTGVWG